MMIASCLMTNNCNTMLLQVSKRFTTLFKSGLFCFVDIVYNCSSMILILCVCYRRN